MELRLIVVPPVPLLVPELGGMRGAAVAVRDAVYQAMSWLVPADQPDDEVVLVARREAHAKTALQGSFRAWGADVCAPGGEYLPELLGQWLLSQRRRAVRSDLYAEPAVVYSSLSEALEHGATRVVVLADGPSGLTEDSPHGLIDATLPLNDACAELCGGAGIDATGLLLSDAAAAEVVQTCQWDAWPLWQELAKEFSGGAAGHLSNSWGQSSWQSLYCGAPFGIGYHVATCEWKEDDNG